MEKGMEKEKIKTAVGMIKDDLSVKKNSTLHGAIKR